ncbi:MULTISPECIES: cell division protein PerM [unclassified Microbacterium]|uniref:cell division protein PerM n=1 Tax=unclassified Microbacterium TaxID=2609290 RepID=UPI0030161AE1
MNRLLVALLAAVDALVAAAVGVAVLLAPLTVLWVVSLGGSADWGALWPAAARMWQLGQLVPVEISLPAEYLAAVGIPADAASFWISLAPLALAGSTAVFAARSGARSARAGAWPVGVAAGAVVTFAVAWFLWRTSANPVAAVFGWQALLLPTAVFALPALAGALVTAWRHGDDGIVDVLRDRLERDPRWRTVPEAAARGVGVALAGFVGVGALLVALATIVRGGQVIALFEAAHVDAVGASVIALGQLAYLPTLVVWGGAFAAGPGFAIGTGTAVSPAGTNLGVLPGIPALGIVPETTSSWLLLTALLIVATGLTAGAAARARMIGASATDGTAPRAVVLAVVVGGGAAGAALLCALASGSLGPGRLAAVGPDAGPVAFAVGLELLVGAAIAMFGPARDAGRSHAVPQPAPHSSAPATLGAPELAVGGRSTAVPADADTEPFAASDLDPLAGWGGSDGGSRT